MEIKNKVAIVTGGASGLGEATVRHYVALGAKVAVFDMNDERGQALQQELVDKVQYYHVDVSDDRAVEQAVADCVSQFGAVHIVNNFAGIAIPGKTIDKHGPMDMTLFRKVIEVNLIGTFNVSRVAAWEMSKNEPQTDCGCRGVIINTASVAAHEGQIGQAAYSASKGAVTSLTLTLARDLARNGIRVNTITPGLIHTPLFDQLPEEVYDSLKQQVLFPQRLGRPQEIAHVSQMLIENDYMNGECIRMDGGIRMQPR